MDKNYIELVNFIDHTSRLKTYLHNTYSEEVAEKIMSEGFNFCGDLHKTSDEIGFNNIDNIGWWNTQRRSYGDFTVVLQIEKDVLSKANEINKIYMPHGQLLSKDRFWNENEADWSFVLHPQYVKGYFDRKKNEGKLNSLFDPSFFDEDLAKENIKKWNKKDGGIRTHDFR
ncbi:MAG: hypothetical protein JW789_00385 [Candidatus Aenigmarchaeota archaeon]|nr:hypothetical protein [Candidatus Aenigmarchaeota archaeon]